MQKPALKLEGVFTAIITPFDDQGNVDYDGLKNLVEWQLESGVDGIVPVGTTGESPTLTVDEHSRVIDTVISAVKSSKQRQPNPSCAECLNRPLVIAGTGGNSTAEALELTRNAKAAGADATLQVTPYYNKPSQEGLYRHFSSVADLGLPVVLYNVPGRSAVEIAIDTVRRLSDHPSIIAVKEAGGCVDRVSSILDVCDIDVLSGDDALTLPMMIAGAKGVISVASNIIPKVMAEMVHAALDENWKKAQELHRCFYRVFTGMFLDTNPVPVKTSAAMLGLCQPVFRLPLCEMQDDTKLELTNVLTKAGIL